jgi:hypothetical protein
MQDIFIFDFYRTFVLRFSSGASNIPQPEKKSTPNKIFYFYSPLSWLDPGGGFERARASNTTNKAEPVRPTMLSASDNAQHVQRKITRKAFYFFMFSFCREMFVCIAFSLAIQVA